MNKKETDCIWIWDTERDSQQGIELEERVKQQQAKEILNIIHQELKQLKLTMNDKIRFENRIRKHLRKK